MTANTVYKLKRRKKVGKFNLIDEPWISVMVNDKGETKLVSLQELFDHAEDYKGLAGDNRTQDFAVLRLILAILHTVFSRLDDQGQAYDCLDLDDRYLPAGPVEGNHNQRKYGQDLLKTWLFLWEAQEFPTIVQDYLKVWHDRFYLLDDKYPFYQVKESVIDSSHLHKKRKPTSLSGKTMNRRISESGNKTAMFSPKGDDKSKEQLNYDEVTRWLITFQGYSGTADKTVFSDDRRDTSLTNAKGWLYDIGGLYLEGDNLFETLMLNLILIHPRPEYRFNLEKPSWEQDDQVLVDQYLSGHRPDNLADLYTNWSRAIHIDEEIDIAKPFQMSIVKLSEIPHQDNFLETMTLWRYNNSGPNKDSFTPRKHPVNQSLWRSYGLMNLKDSQGENQRRPGIMDWYTGISKRIDKDRVRIVAVTLVDDGNATSWSPVNEVFDRLGVNQALITDLEDQGWVEYIYSTVEKTKDVIDRTYRYFLKQVKTIRQLPPKHQFVDQEVSQAYYEIDRPFRTWLSSIEALENKDMKVIDWQNQLYQLLQNQAQKVVDEAGQRDYKGLVDDDRVKNIFTAHNYFTHQLKEKLITKEEFNEGQGWYL